MKKKFDALKVKNVQTAGDNQRNIKENPVDQTNLFQALLKSQLTTNKLLEQLMDGQKDILSSLQDSQSILGKVARIQGALYKIVKDQNSLEQPFSPDQKNLYKTAKSEQKKFRYEGFSDKSPKKDKNIIIQQDSQKHQQHVHKTQMFKPQNRTPQQFRDITICIQIPTIAAGTKLSLQDLQMNLRGWIAELFTVLSKATFAGYYQRRKLSQDEAKIYFSRNLIFNVVNLLHHARLHQADFWKNSSSKAIRMFEQGSKKIIGFLKLKYPQKKKLLYNPEIQNLIQSFDDSQNIDFDIIYNSGCSFNNKQQTWAQIKLFLNKLLKQIKSNYEPFTQVMLDIFTINKGKDNQRYTIKNAIGSKIDIGVPLFDDKQIQKPGIRIFNSQILRVIVKWVECIQKLFFKTDEFFEKRNGQSFKFKTSFERLSQKVEMKSREEIQQELESINSLRQDQKELLDRLADDLPAFIQKYSSTFNFLPSSQYQVGLFTSIMTRGIHDAISEYLKQLIDKTVDIGGDFSFLYFDVYDLLRARCSGTKDQILQVYNNLEKSKFFKIIRVKNRMKTSNQDFMVNMIIKNSPIICELQLCIVGQKNEESQKQDYLNHFNHFLYELQRSKYGSICQSVILCSSLSDTISYFSIDNLQQKAMVSRRSQQKLNNLNINLKEIDDIKIIKKQKRASIIESPQFVQYDQNASRQIKDFKQIKRKKYILQVEGFSVEPNKYSFICHSCKVFVQSFTSFIQVLKSEQKNFSICADCLLLSLSIVQRTKYLVGSQFSDYFDQTILSDVKEKKPKFIAVIQKSFYKKIVFCRYIQVQNSTDPYVSFNYKYSNNKISYSFEQLKNCYIFVLKPEVKIVETPVDNTLFQKMQNKKQDKKEKKPQIYLYNTKSPVLLKKHSDNFQQKELSKKLPMEILLLAKDFIHKQPMVLTAFILNEKQDVRLLDIQPSNFEQYYQKTIKQWIKQKKIKQFIQQRRKNWFYKNGDLNEQDLKNISSEKLDLVQTLECPKSLFVQLPKQFTHIKQIFLNNNHIIQIDLKALNLPFLEKLEVMENKLNKIVGFQCCLNLLDLRISNNQLKTLDFSNVKWEWITRIDFSDNPIESVIGLSSKDGNKALKAPQLKNLYVSLKNGKNLDLSGVKSQNLFDFICSGNENAQCSIVYPSLQSISKLKINSFNNLPFNKQNFNSLIFLSLQRIHISEFILQQTLEVNKLQSIYLCNSVIKSIKINCNINKLKQLKISKCCLEQLQFKQGTDFSQLVQINLSHNLIQKINLTTIHKMDKLEKLNLGYNMITQLKMNPSVLKSLNHISLDHNPCIVDIIADYAQYGFTDFPHLESIQFGYNMNKQESTFWFFSYLSKMNKINNKNPDDQLSKVVSKILEIKQYCEIDSVFNYLLFDLGFNEMEFKVDDNQHFKKFLDSSSEFIRLVEKRGGEITSLGAQIYEADVQAMQ